jgi:hypothetical protein
MSFLASLKVFDIVRESLLTAERETASSYHGESHRARHPRREEVTAGEEEALLSATFFSLF